MPVVTFTATKRLEFLTELRRGATLISAAKKVDVALATVKKHRAQSPVFAALVQEALDLRLENVGDALYVAAMKGNVTAQIFFLCNRTRHMARNDARKWVNVNAVQVDLEFKREVESFLDELHDKLDPETYGKVANAIGAIAGSTAARSSQTN